MKKMSHVQMESVQAAGWGRKFFDGFACGFGIATAGTGIGAVVAVWGCARFFEVI